MTFWIIVIGCMVVANILTILGVAGMWKLHERRKAMLVKIERGNMAFEHLLAAQKQPPPPPPNVVPFKKTE